MITGSTGTFVISWTQTELDGVPAAPVGDLAVGATWRWAGEVVRVDGTRGVLLRLDGPQGEADLRKRAAHVVRRLIGAAVGCRDVMDEYIDEGSDDRVDQGFVLTDGRSSFTASLIETSDTQVPLLMFLGEVPPQHTDLWVVRKMNAAGTFQEGVDPAGGVICFTPGTFIRTDSGVKLIETLIPGDRVLTRDDGPQEILWIGQRKMTGARLYAMPGLRPVRIRAGALGIDRPDPDLLVSPEHRMLIRGRAAQALFNTPEVLVTARDLVNNRSVAIDRALREVTYIHLFLERHQVIWANGLESESFHPANTSIELVEERERETLLAMYPMLVSNPQSYGEYARRNLSTSEAAILRHDGGIKAA